METLFDKLLTPQILTISAAIVALLFSIGKMKINEVSLANSRKYKKILPILPLILGVIASLCPGVLGSTEDPISLSSKILIGLWCGLVASQSRTIVKRIFAKDQLPPN